MPRYAELTTNLGDGLTRTLERIQELQVGAITRVNRALGRFVPELPPLPYADRLPSARSVVEANYALADTVLRAQKRYALGLLDALSRPPRPERAPRKKAQE